MSFAYGLVLGVLLGVVGLLLVAVFGALRLSSRISAAEERARPPRDPELELLLRRFAEQGPDSMYDGMCRDCGQISRHMIGCPELDRIR